MATQLESTRHLTAIGRAHITHRHAASHAVAFAASDQNPLNIVPTLTLGDTARKPATPEQTRAALCELLWPEMRENTKRNRHNRRFKQARRLWERAPQRIKLDAALQAFHTPSTRPSKMTIALGEQLSRSLALYSTMPIRSVEELTHSLRKCAINTAATIIRLIADTQTTRGAFALSHKMHIALPKQIATIKDEIRLATDAHISQRIAANIIAAAQHYEKPANPLAHWTLAHASALNPQPAFVAFIKDAFGLGKGWGKKPTHIDAFVNSVMAGYTHIYYENVPQVATDMPLAPPN